MLFDGLNDYELIYLIRENNDVALNLMYKKYSIYIRKVIYEYRMDGSCKEEVFQEGLMVLNTAIKCYDTEYQKTFFKYFDLILRREFNRLYKKVKRYDIPLEEVHVIAKLEEPIVSYNVAIDDSVFEQLKEDELLIFNEIFINSKKCRDVAKENSLDIKKIYNVIQKIKKLIKKSMS